MFFKRLKTSIFRRSFLLKIEDWFFARSLREGEQASLGDERPCSHPTSPPAAANASRLSEPPKKPVPPLSEPHPITFYFTDDLKITRIKSKNKDDFLSLPLGE